MIDWVYFILIYESNIHWSTLINQPKQGRAYFFNLYYYETKLWGKIQ